MKKVSEIRIDLGNIPGALTSKIPPELGKKGDKEALPIHSPADESTSENREDFREKPKSESVNGTYEPVPYFESGKTLWDGCAWLVCFFPLYRTTMGYIYSKISNSKICCFSIWTNELQSL